MLGWTASTGGATLALTTLPVVASAVAAGVAAKVGWAGSVTSSAVFSIDGVLGSKLAHPTRNNARHKPMGSFRALANVMWFICNRFSRFAIVQKYRLHCL